MTNFVYLLDTNILSDLIRKPGGKIAKRIAEVGEETICTSIIVACELRFGAEKKKSPLLQLRVEELLQVLEVLAMDADADRHYGDIRAKLEAAGTPIGPNDLLIAAHARSLNLTLISANARELSRVAGLSIENWLE